MRCVGSSLRRTKLHVRDLSSPCHVWLLHLLQLPVCASARCSAQAGVGPGTSGFFRAVPLVRVKARLTIKNAGCCFRRLSHTAILTAKKTLDSHEWSSHGCVYSTDCLFISLSRDQFYQFPSFIITQFFHFHRLSTKAFGDLYTQKSTLCVDLYA